MTTEHQNIRGSDGEGQRSEYQMTKPSHERLWIWQRARKLHLKICELCRRMPRNERFKLVDQAERSSKAVKDNIAEGNESYYYNDKLKGLFTARKEAAETQNHIREMEDKQYIIFSMSQSLIDEYEEIKRGINGLVRSVSFKRDMNNKKRTQKI
jgi:four helix bundle protein